MRGHAVTMRRWIAANLIAVTLVGGFTVAGGALRGYSAAHPDPYQSVDERSYARLARYLSRYHAYKSPEMADPTHWAPGAPFVFAIAHRIGQVYPAEAVDVPSAYPVQAAIGTIQIPATFALAALLAGPFAGVAAAGLIAFYPPLITASGDLLSEPLGALMLTFALIATVLALRRGGAKRALLAGVLLGLTVLVRADMLPIPFLLAVLVGGVWWSRSGRRAGITTGAAMLAGILLMLAPWSAYASKETGGFVPVSSGGASNLYVGTFLPGKGTMFGLKRQWAERTMAANPKLQGEPYWRLPAKTVIDTVAAANSDGGRLDREDALRAAAKDNIRKYVIGDPLGFTALGFRKARRMWLGYTVGTHGQEVLAIKLYHLLIVAIGMVGLAAGIAVRRGRAPELWVVAIAVLALTAMNVILVSEARHNLPLIPVLVAGGVAGLAGVITQRRGDAGASSESSGEHHAEPHGAAT
jgi:4-amino-4-deoxy-L-arabinose transferase-like glycosyltransferase